MAGFIVEREALYTEAKMWADDPPVGWVVGEPETIFTGDITDRSMSEVAGSAAGAAEAMELTPRELSWVAVETGLLATYDQLRRKVVRLLREGRWNFEAIATTLIDISREYGRVDEEADSALRGRWQPMPQDEL